MYHWQTLALARAEMLLPKSQEGKDAAEAVKAFLLCVNQPHFPHPAVWLRPSAFWGARVALTWAVDDRTLDVKISPGGRCSSERSPGADPGIRNYPIDPEFVSQDVHWLLFGGDQPAEAEPNPAPAQEAVA